MDRDNVIQLAEMLTEQEPKEARGWITIPCPMAGVRHSSGRDTSPSFGIAVNPDGISVWNCFSCCPDSRPLFGLVPYLRPSFREYPHKIARFILAHEHASGTAQEEISGASDPWKAGPTIPDKRRPECLPEKALRRFPLLSDYSPAATREYRDFLYSRGIPESVWSALGIRIFPGRPFLIFPFTDSYGRECVLRARGVRRKELFSISPKVAGFPRAVFPSLGSSGAWFGLHLIDARSPVVAVEGELDALRLQALGFPNVIASGGTSVSWVQLAALTVPQVIVGFDADSAGKLASLRITQYLRLSACVSELDWSVVGVKDAGDLRSREQAQEVFSQARIVS